jgi:hypothetical protein
VNSPPPKPEVILTNLFAEPTVLLVPITSREYILNESRNNVWYVLDMTSLILVLSKKCSRFPLRQKQHS